MLIMENASREMLGPHTLKSNYARSLCIDFSHTCFLISPAGQINLLTFPSDYASQLMFCRKSFAQTSQRKMVDMLIVESNVNNHKSIIWINKKTFINLNSILLIHSFFYIHRWQILSNKFLDLEFTYNSNNTMTICFRMLI